MTRKTWPELVDEHTRATAMDDAHARRVWDRIVKTTGGRAELTYIRRDVDELVASGRSRLPRHHEPRLRYVVVQRPGAVRALVHVAIAALITAGFVMGVWLGFIA